MLCNLKIHFEVLSYHCTLSEGTRCFLHKYQHSCFSAIRATPSVCLQAGGLSYGKGAPGAAHCSPLPAGAAGGRGREPFLCLTLPLGKLLATSREEKKDLYTAVYHRLQRNKTNTPVSFAQGKVFYSKFSMQYYCRGRQVLKKTSHGRSREKQNQNILAAPSAIYLLLEVHMDTNAQSKPLLSISRQNARCTNTHVAFHALIYYILTFTEEEKNQPILILNI